jgi:hypothetical protein
MHIKQVKQAIIWIFLFIIVFAAEGFAAKGDTTRVSVDSSGIEGNGDSSWWPSISSDGADSSSGNKSLNCDGS